MRLRNWLVLGAVLSLAACGSSGSTATSPTTTTTTVPTGSTASATIDVPAPDGATGDYGQSKDKSQSSFTPATVTVPVGGTVTWTNSDITTHTTTALAGAWNATMAPGASFSRVFPTAGTFDYKCTIHAAMSGTITVK
jgi:plastocyanin